MPDHLHMLIGVPRDTPLLNLIRDFKRITTRIANIAWQRNFSITDCEMMREIVKAAYIRVNPVRAGLIAEHQRWSYAIGVDDLD